MHALANAKDGDKKAILSVLGKADAGDEEVKDVIGVLKSCGSIGYAEDKVGELIESAKAALGILPDSAAKASLLELADYLVARVR